MLPARDSSHRKRYPQTKGERMGKKHTMHMDTAKKLEYLSSFQIMWTSSQSESEVIKKDIHSA